MFRTRRLLLPLLAALITMLGVFATPACSILNGAQTLASVAINGGIQAATGLYIQRKGGGDPTKEAAAANQIILAATALESAVKGEMTVTQFNSFLRPYIAQLPRDGQLFMNELVPIVDQYFVNLTSNPNGSPLTAATNAAAGVILADVIAAASFYTAAPAASVRLASAGAEPADRNNRLTQMLADVKPL